MEQITNSVISILIQRLYDSLANENKTLRGFKDEFEKMKGKLELMTSFLNEAQRLKKTHENYMTVKAILARVRELIYDADDILLDCQTRAAYEDISPLHGYTVRRWSFRHNAGNILNHINIRFAEMEKQLETFLVPGEKMIQKYDEGSSQGSGSFARRTSHVLGPDKIIGLQEDTDKIIEHITKNENSRSIGIVGMGGSGKTTIAQKVFYHQKVIHHFDKRVWVSVSHIFSPKNFMASMLKQLSCDESAYENDEMFQIHWILKHKKYLIVIDDVWNLDYDWWGQMSSSLPEGETLNKSIIITTRNEEAVRKMGVKHIHYARDLNEDESWALFTEVAFHTNDKGEDSEFQKVGKEIVKKCDGHPLAIKTLAGLLSSKPFLSEWEEVRDNFQSEVANNSSVSAILQLSYDDLPATLKLCILSFSIFPEDSEINAEQLVYWWVGEGFVRGNGKKTAMEEASQCLSDLVNRCLVGTVKPRGYDGRVYKCKMHDLVRDLIIKMSKKETFSSFDVGNKQIPDQNSRHLGYTGRREEKLLENNSKLRAFLLMENSVLPSLQGTGLATIKSLRVLDLSQNEQESISVEDLLRWIKYQKRLAYLNLRRISGLVALPHWIRNHQNLQILILKECLNLKRLPSSITSLQNLIVLDVENCPLKNLPRGLAKLVNLQVLSGFKFGSPGKDGARLRDLMGLKELRELGIKLSNKDDIVDDEEYNLSHIVKLKILSIDTKDCEQKQTVLVNKLVPPLSLRELYLRFYQGDTTPNWVSPTFLPELLYLYIDHAPITTVNTNFWGSNENPWKIEGLCFRHLLRFQVKWDEVCNWMKYLRYVEVDHCQRLQAFPIDVNNYGIWVKEDTAHTFQNREGKVSREASTSEA